MPLARRLGRAVSSRPAAARFRLRRVHRHWTDWRLGKEKIRWWNLEPVATVPRYDSSPLCDSAWCRPYGARPLIDQSQALASGWVGDAVMLLLPPFNKASKLPLLLTALIRTTVWARLVPSRLTGFGCGCQSTRVDPCPSTTPGPEPGREGYTQALSQHPQSPYSGGGDTPFVCQVGCPPPEENHAPHF